MVERTEREELLSIISDVYKDAYGFRPRGLYTTHTVEELRFTLKELSKAADAQMELEREREAACAVAFEKRISDLIATGAGNRETAIRWDKSTWADGDGNIDHIDDGYYEYLNGLPYGYFNQIAEAA